jgi:hypothetical protein
VQSYGRRFRLAIVLQYCNDAATLTATRAFTLSSVELKIPSVSPSTGLPPIPAEPRHTNDAATSFLYNDVG